jgi:hypothetical protein
VLSAGVPFDDFSHIDISSDYNPGYYPGYRFRLK